jgi:ketosteroid isomerase-like protein
MMQRRETTLQPLDAARLKSTTELARLRAVLEAFNRRDGADFDALLDREAEIVPVRAAIEAVSHRGPDAGSQYCKAVDESWEDLRWEVEKIRDAGSCVIALGRIQGRGRDSGAVIDATGAWVAHVRGGRIRRFQTYSDRSKAFEAARLTDQKAPPA